ncbi:unnamed protein product, partial [Menidia menidia]
GTGVLRKQTRHRSSDANPRRRKRSQITYLDWAGQQKTADHFKKTLTVPGLLFYLDPEKPRSPAKENPVKNKLRERMKQQQKQEQLHSEEPDRTAKPDSWQDPVDGHCPTHAAEKSQHANLTGRREPVGVGQKDQHPAMKRVAVPHFYNSLFSVLQLCLVHMAHGGAYYGQKQPPQQHQPLPQYSDGYPQQQFLGNDMPNSPYGKDVPLLAQFGKDFPQMPPQIAKRTPLTNSKDIDKLSLEELKVHLYLFLVEIVSDLGRKEFRVPQDQQDHQDHKVQLGLRVRDCQVLQENQGPLVLRATEEMEKLVCQDCRENPEDLDPQEQKVTLVQAVVKGQRDFRVLKVSQVPLDSLGFQKQEVRDYQDCQVLQGKLVKKVSLGFLELQAQRETKDLVYLVFQA